MLPFSNVLVEIQLSGAEVSRVIELGSDRPAIGGLNWINGEWVLTRTGQPLDRQATYSVLVNDFMYAGGSAYRLLADLDPDGYNTAIDWRQPVIDWILAQESSPEAPLDRAINGLGW